jgi:putative phosphoesterase
MSDMAILRQSTELHSTIETLLPPMDVNVSSQVDLKQLPTLRRIAVIGDIHCEDERLAIAIRHLASLNVDATVAVGDIVDGKGDANRACNILAESGVLAVMGNHDRWLLEGRIRDLPGATPSSALNPSAYSWLENLPKTRSFQTLRGPLLLCHGMGEDDMNRIYPDSQGYELESNLPLSKILNEKHYRFVINGHTHQPMVRRIQGLTIINGGCLCHQERPVCSVVDFDERNVQFFEVNATSTVRAETLVLG